MKKILTKERGITLIALVITIIVLLILAGVSIAMLTGDNGILTQSKQAKIETAKGSLKEEINLMIQKRKIDEARGKKVSLKEELEKEISGEKEIEEIEGIVDACYLSKENQTVTVYEDGTIAEGKIIWDGISKTKPEIDSEGNWHIKGANELKFFEEFVNGKLSEEEKQGINIVETTTIYLENHIDLGARQENGTKTRGTNWDSIGKVNKFLGKFEGNNYTIRGMYIDQAENFAGLFGKINEIRNLKIKDSYVIGGNCIGGMAGIGLIMENCHNENTTVISREGNYYTIGGIVGEIDLKISNCSNTGKIIANGKRTKDGYSGCGGIAGQTYNKDKKEIIIKNCTNQGKVIGKGERVGGIVGNTLNETTIKECKNSGEIIGENNKVGGIAGRVLGNIEKSENQGKVIVKGERVGGIVGQTSLETTIKECKNSGEIIGENNCVGGIVGIAFGNIENSHNIGAIIGKGSVGGILGQIGKDCESNIVNCSNEGKIEATGIYNEYNEIAVGGIIGWTSLTGTSGKIENVYNKGEVFARDTTGRGIGGIIGRNSNNFQLVNCYNKGAVNGKNGIGSMIGIQTENNNENASNLYYLNTLGIKAINNQDDASKNIIGVSDDINSYEEFLNWIVTKQ